MENHYFENTGKGTFVEDALDYGVAYGENGQGVSSMGPVVGISTARVARHLHSEPELLHSVHETLKQGANFVHQTAISGLSLAMAQYAGWGAVAFDYDNDGWLDLFTTHGDAHHEYWRRTF